MTTSMKKRMFQLLVGSVFAIGTVTAAFSVAVSEKTKMDAALPSEQHATEMLDITSKIAHLNNDESNRVRLLQAKAEYASLMATKASHAQPVNDGDVLDWALAADEYNCQIDHKHTNEVNGSETCTDEPSKYINPKVNG